MQQATKDARHVLGGAPRRSIVDRLLLCRAGSASAASLLLIWLGSCMLAERGLAAGLYCWRVIARYKTGCFSDLPRVT
jgi:hypothetical protein